MDCRIVVKYLYFLFFRTKEEELTVLFAFSHTTGGFLLERNWFVCAYPFIFPCFLFSVELRAPSQIPHRHKKAISA